MVLMETILLDYLKATRLINADDDAIVAKKRELTRGIDDPNEKARRIFYFVRDQIRYVFRTGASERAYRASMILNQGRGFCTQKAILFCSLARSCGIPAGIYFFDIADHTLPQNVRQLLGSNILFWHGVTALSLNGNWFRFDATLDRKLVEKNKLISVEFDPNRDCLMSSITQNGTPHIEYIRDHGMVADVSFQQISDRFQQSYPHLFPRRGQLFCS
mgnify:CR=1 FL=1